MPDFEVISETQAARNRLVDARLDEIERRIDALTRPVAKEMTVSQWDYIIRERDEQIKARDAVIRQLVSVARSFSVSLCAGSVFARARATAEGSVWRLFRYEPSVVDEFVRADMRDLDRSIESAIAAAEALKEQK